MLFDMLFHCFSRNEYFIIFVGYFLFLNNHFKIYILFLIGEFVMIQFYTMIIRYLFCK